MGASESVPQKSIHDFTVKVFFFIVNFCSVMMVVVNNRNHLGFVQDSRGKDVDLSIYKGKVLLVVNVASKWLFFPSCSILFFFRFGNISECLFGCATVALLIPITPS